MNIDNVIEAQYRRLKNVADDEFSELYVAITHEKLRAVFGTVHRDLVNLFGSMNQRLPTGPESEAHYWADPSRELLEAIDIIERLERPLKNTQYSFTIDPYYKELLEKCKTFLRNGGGSAIPRNMEKVDIYYTIPIFIMQTTITLVGKNELTAQLNIIGEGSYAQVFKYYDEFYCKEFVVKRALKDLSGKEIDRFKTEFDTMKSLKSPYVVDVYRYDEKKNEYYMEYMDQTLLKYINMNNSLLSVESRKGICLQILKANLSHF